MESTRDHLWMSMSLWYLKVPSYFVTVPNVPAVTYIWDYYKCNGTFRCKSRELAHTIRGWHSITVWEAKDGGSGDGLICRELRHIRGVPFDNCNCCSSGYMGGKKLLAAKRKDWKSLNEKMKQAFLQLIIPRNFANN